MDFSNDERKGRPTTMILWENHKHHILNTCLENNYGHRDMAFWRDFLFATTVSFMIPLSLIALIPSLYLSYLNELYVLVGFDLVAVFSLLLIAHVPGISLALRKWVFIGIIYGMGVILIYFLGNLGPGLLFLLAISIFMVLIFPVKYAFASLYINLITCTLIGVWIYTTESHQAPLPNTLDLRAWIAISSNLIFLGAVFSLLIPKLLNGLQDSMEEQSKLKNKLSKQKSKLKQSLRELEEKNTELEHFAYVASHDLQEPLRMVTGFLQLLESKYINQLDEKARSYIKSVKDNGIGLDPSFSDRIFIIFQRLHPREQYSGTGIGLAIVKKIIEYHGGKIWVDSEEGKGSTFFFTLSKTQPSSA